MSPSLKVTAAITAGVAVTSLLVYHRTAVTDYYTNHRGINGICRYIWIGDYLPPNIRQSMDDLDEISQDMSKCEMQLENIEILVQRASLESVDGPIDQSGTDTDTTPKEDIQKQIFQQNPELRKDIGFFSTRLDRLAARIDSVLSHSDEDVKKRKKQMSNKVVELMDALDKMVATFYLAVK